MRLQRDLPKIFLARLAPSALPCALCGKVLPAIFTAEHAEGRGGWKWGTKLKEIIGTIVGAAMKIPASPSALLRVLCGKMLPVCGTVSLRA